MTVEIHQDFVEIAQGISWELAAAIAAIGPIQLNPRRDSPFPERLCRAVAGQQLSVKAAETIWNRLLDSTNQQSLVEHLTTAAPQALRACGLSAAKIKTMRAIASATLSGQIDEAALAALDHSDRTQRLTTIWGVGQWTADMMGIFYFGDPDIWPEGDTTARKTLEILTSRRRKTTRTAAHFTPYRTYLALYMWHRANTPLA